MLYCTLPDGVALHPPPVASFGSFPNDTVTVTAWVRITWPSNKTLLSYMAGPLFAIAIDAAYGVAVTAFGATWTSRQLVALMDSQW